MSKLNSTKQIGNLGETIAARYLASLGFTVLSRNYRKKFGELDIIALKDKIVHFVEVKSVSYETRQQLEHALEYQSWRPEEKVHRFKMGQISRTLESWIAEKGYEGEWSIDVIAVRIVPRETYATVNFIENVIFE